MVTVKQFTDCFGYREKELIEEDKVLTGGGKKMIKKYIFIFILTFVNYFNIMNIVRKNLI